MKYVIEVEDQGKPLYWKPNDGDVIYTTEQMLDYISTRGFDPSGMSNNGKAIYFGRNIWFTRVTFCET